MSAGLMKPNWFDQTHEKGMGKATAEQCLEIIAKDSRIVQAIKDALTRHDAHMGPGPSRPQAVRSALCEVLQED